MVLLQKIGPVWSCFVTNQERKKMRMLNANGPKSIKCELMIQMKNYREKIVTLSDETKQK